MNANLTTGEMLAITLPVIRSTARRLARGEADLADDLMQVGSIRMWLRHKERTRTPGQLIVEARNVMRTALRTELRRRRDSLDAVA
jgi:hypothetical protein